MLENQIAGLDPEDYGQQLRVPGYIYSNVF